MRDGGIAYLLIECQARVDPAMPVRMLDAAAALYLDLRTSPPTQAGYAADRVPPVRCVVVYGGERPWGVAVDVRDMIVTGGAEAVADILRMHHEVVDLRRCPDPGGDGNLAVLLVRPAGLRRSGRAEPGDASGGVLPAHEREGLG